MADDQQTCHGFSQHTTVPNQMEMSQNKFDNKTFKISVKDKNSIVADTAVFPFPFSVCLPEEDNQSASCSDDNECIVAQPKSKEYKEYFHSPSKKPKWWRQIAGRRATKIQRDAISRMEKRGYVLKKPPHGLFLTLDFPPSTEICLEIGFGNGENLLENSKRNPDRGWVGAELFQPGVGNVSKRMEEEMVDDNMPGLYKNVRIYPGDGTKLLKSIQCNSLEMISLTFPDPFSNNGQEKWRILQMGILKEMRRVLKPRGRFMLATDSKGFEEWANKLFKEDNWDEVEVIERDEWLPVVSRYEEKGLKEGRITLLKCWRLT